MEILEQPLEWLRAFQDAWPADQKKNGTFDWSHYTYPHNTMAPHSRGINLAASRLMVITTTGAFYPNAHEPFESDKPLGDYSIRVIPTSAPLEKLSFGNPHFDHQFAQKDPQVLLPLRHLQEMVGAHLLGSLAPVFISFYGFQPNAIRVVKELIPNIISVAQEYQANAALIIPAGHLCIQSAGLVARALEVNHIATTLTAWDADMATLTAPPRLTATHLPAGCPLGMPGDRTQQLRVLSSTLKLLEVSAPTGVIYLNESAPV